MKTIGNDQLRELTELKCLNKQLCLNFYLFTSRSAEAPLPIYSLLTHMTMGMEMKGTSLFQKHSEKDDFFYRIEINRNWRLLLKFKSVLKTLEVNYRELALKPDSFYRELV